MMREIHVYIVYTEFTYLSSRACGAMRLNGAVFNIRPETHDKEMSSASSIDPSPAMVKSP